MNKKKKKSDRVSPVCEKINHVENRWKINVSLSDGMKFSPLYEAHKCV